MTALLASFMSGMAGNVTAFNTVWTYDIYQSYFKREASDAHYLMVGRVTTVAGIVLSIATAYLATQFNNIMDLLQLVFAFVNAPLVATFLLGMFWTRTTGHGAFAGRWRARSPPQGTGAEAAQRRRDGIRGAAPTGSRRPQRNGAEFWTRWAGRRLPDHDRGDDHESEGSGHAGRVGIR